MSAVYATANSCFSPGQDLHKAFPALQFQHPASTPRDITGMRLQYVSSGRLIQNGAQRRREVRHLDSRPERVISLGAGGVDGSELIRNHPSAATSY
jgi:hypothetical protein